MNNNFVLAIETSCDDTCAAIISKETVLSNEKIDQSYYHRQYGGIYPKLATRLHYENIDEVIKTALKNSKCQMDKVNKVVYTSTPGLQSSLFIGRIAAEAIGRLYKIDVYKENHLISHLAFNSNKNITFPAFGLVISGGHTNLYYMESYNKWKLLGETRDNAIGEVFDKIGRDIQLVYPGGVEMDHLACNNKKYNEKLLDFKIFNEKNNISFSYSGLKSSAQRFIKSNTFHSINHFCESILYSAYEQIIINLKKATILYPDVKSIIIGGGVSASSYLKKFINEKDFMKNFSIYFPSMQFATDNAAMIGLLHNKKMAEQKSGIKNI